MHRFRSATTIPAALLLLATAFLAGCSSRDNPVGVADPGRETSASLMSARTLEDGIDTGVDPLARGFYPLVLGNRWSFEVSTSFRSGPPGGPYDDPIVVTEDQDRELVCEEVVGDHTYVVEETRSVHGTNTSTWWVRYRQDARGLYERDPTSTDPPACVQAGAAHSGMIRIGAENPGGDALSARIEAAIPDAARRRATLAAWQTMRDRLRGVSSSIAAGIETDRLRRPRGGVTEGEITRLRYPLRRGTRWVIREDPRFQAVVEGLEVLRTPRGPVVAWRIRLLNEFLGPKDRVHQWVSRAGFVKLVVHLELEGTDQNGEPLVSEIDTLERLTDFQVSRRPHERERSPMEPVAAE